MKHTIGLLVFRNLYLILILSVLSVGAYAMSILDAGKVCLFSKISWIITLEGNPVANALLTRTAKLSKDKVDTTQTDENGYFEMPAVFERTITKFLPQEFVAKQVIVVDYNNQKYDIWSGVKRTEEENAESRGNPLIVSCELTQKDFDLIEVNGSPIFSRCQWDVEPDPSKTDLFNNFGQE